MTNFEFWKDRLAEIAGKYEGVALINGKPVACDGDCRDCERSVRCECEIDGAYIGYVACFEHWCRRWKKDRSFEEVK